MSVSRPIFRVLLSVHGLSINIVHWRGAGFPCFTRMLTDCGEEYHVCEVRGTGTCKAAIRSREVALPDM